MTFRGDSRFTTWAYGFVVFKASARLASEARRQFPVTMDDDTWDLLPDLPSVEPHQRAQQREMHSALRHAIDEDLTDHQRYVFVSVALNDARPEELAAQLGSTRNAIYKVLFDARRRLQVSLVAAGYRPSVCAQTHRSACLTTRNPRAGCVNSPSSHRRPPTSHLSRNPRRRRRGRR